ncbi:MAG TPA: transaldolase [Steroidobacteraceae bacterium]|nr:transaldolase [Steroidobacteraceae bacterium]HUA23675.1 transaldolase [Steroidobacteraceae bacterium]
MQATKRLSCAGQSIWLDNITRDLLLTGTLERYIRDLSVTGLTSNPTIFDKALRHGTAYDKSLRGRARVAISAEELFFELALEDITRAADLFLPIHERTAGVDGWVSLEVSPLLASDAKSTLAEAKDLHARAGRPNLFIKIPGTADGLEAIEESIFAGIPINVTLLFSAQQYRAAAEAWLRGVERRIEAGLNPSVASVASLFVSRWDVAVAGKVPAALDNKLGIAVAEQTHQAYSQLLQSARWRRAQNAGARPQRLLFASTGTKDPKASDVLYVKELIAPLTVNTMPEGTLQAFAAHGEMGPELRPDGGDSAAVLREFIRSGIDPEALAARLQQEGAAAFVASWKDLLGLIDSKTAATSKELS